MIQLKTSHFIARGEGIAVSQYLEKMDDHFEHTHEFIELVYIWSGSGHHFVNGTNYFVTRGDLIFMMVGDSHRHYSNQPIGIFNCYIDPDFFVNELLDNEGMQNMLVLEHMKERAEVHRLPPHISFNELKDIEDIETILGLIKEETETKAEGYKIAIKIYMNTLLTKIFRTRMKQLSTGGPDVYGKISPEIFDYIKENYHSKINLYEIAKEYYYTPNYFSKIFKEYCGKSFTQYVNELRVNEAMRLLAADACSIEHISGEVGYKDKTQFYKIFKTQTGLTPMQYRMQHKKKAGWNDAL